VALTLTTSQLCHGQVRIFFHGSGLRHQTVDPRLGRAVTVGLRLLICQGKPCLGAYFTDSLLFGGRSTIRRLWTWVV